MSKTKITWEKINKKYPEKREQMSLKRLREFVADCFDCYEQEGFVKTFWSPFEEQTEHIGKTFVVKRRTPEEEFLLEHLPAWDIELEDGTCVTAFPEEIILSEMKANGYIENEDNTVIKNLIKAVMDYAMEVNWTDTEAIESLVTMGITQKDFEDCGYGEYVSEYFAED